MLDLEGTYGSDRKSDDVEVSTVGGPLFDGREMVMVHNMLRREFALLPELVCGVTARDRARRQIIGNHVEALIVVLHHHHRSEDEYVWPLLVERCANLVAALTGAMEDQHEQVAAQLDAVSTALKVWRVAVTADSRKHLADALDRLIPTLRQHLSDEELRVVPLMEQYLTAAEFIEMVRKGAANADPAEFALGFGMLMYEGDPDIIDAAITNMDAEVRPAIRQQAAQAFADHSRRVHGTATPPRSTELGTA